MCNANVHSAKVSSICRLSLSRNGLNSWHFRWLRWLHHVVNHAWWFYKSIPNPNEMTQKAPGHCVNDQWPQLCLWNGNDWTETDEPVQTHKACSQVQERMNQKVTLTLMKRPKKSLVIESMTNHIVAAIWMTQNGKVKPKQWGEQWCGPNPILVTSCPFGTASKMTQILTPTLIKWTKKSLVISGKTNDLTCVFGMTKFGQKQVNQWKDPKCCPKCCPSWKTVKGFN